MHAALPNIENASIDFIYMDPPFMAQQDRHLATKRNPDDDVTDSNKPVYAYSDHWNIADYLTFLDLAIQQLKPLLKSTGTIAIHTDYRTSSQIRCLLDEHFGAACFVNELIWKYGLGNAKSARNFPRKHDTITVYGKTTEHYFNKVRGEITPAQRQKYRHKDEKGLYLNSYGKKYYLKGGKPLESVLDIPSLAPTAYERCGYPTQKPMQLLSILIESFCPPGGRVLDPCCGSGTTAVAAQTAGKSWVAIDRGALAIHMTKRRLLSQASTEDAAPVRFTAMQLDSEQNVTTDCKMIGSIDDDGVVTVNDAVDAYAVGTRSQSSPELQIHKWAAKSQKGQQWCEELVINDDLGTISGVLVLRMWSREGFCFDRIVTDCRNYG